MIQLKRTLSRLPPKNEWASNRIHTDSLLHMYYEDWVNWVIPYVLRGNDPGFKVIVNHENQKEFARKLFHTSGRSRDTLEESLSLFMREVTQSLIMFDGAAYEVCEEIDNGDDEFVIRVPGKRKSNAEKPKPLPNRYALKSITFDSVYVSGEEVIQPFYTDRGQIDKVEKINRNRVLLIPSPSWIEGGKGFSGILNVLEGFSLQNFSPMKFFSEQNLEKSNFFDYSKFQHFQDTSILKETASSGWRGRSLYSNKISEFYTVLRFLRFKKSQAELRNYIISEINIFLSGFPQIGLPEIELKIEGLPNTEEIDSCILALKDGSMGFEEIVNKFPL